MCRPPPTMLMRSITRFFSISTGLGQPLPQGSSICRESTLGMVSSSGDTVQSTSSVVLGIPSV